MTSRSFLFTSESVTEGHPDKVADQISDSVLDAVLASDPEARVACETLITTGLVVVAGEITTSTYVDIPRVVRARIADIGYTRAKYGFDAETCGVIVALDEQSADIAQGVDAAYEVQHDPSDGDPLDRVGAGDQGMMFGYASNETPELMPLPIMLAHGICKRLSEVRRRMCSRICGPTARHRCRCATRSAATAAASRSPSRTSWFDQHRDGLDADTLIKPDIIEHVLRPILPTTSSRARWNQKYFVYVNPTGKFVIGGPMGDTGLAARRSSSTRTAVRHRTAVGRSRARTRPGSTARRRTPRATSRRTWSPPVSPIAARSRWRTRSVSRSRSRFMSSASAPSTRMFP